MKKAFASIIFLLLTFALCELPAQTSRSSSAVKKEQIETAKKISQTKQRIDENTKLMRARVNALNSLQAEIDTKNAAITGLRKKIAGIDRDIKITSDSIDTITSTVKRLRDGAAKSVRQARSMKQSMTSTSLIFTSKNFNELLRRFGYLKQLDKSRNAKTANLRNSLSLLEAKKLSLDSLRKKQSAAIASLQKEQAALADRQSELEIVVTDLKKNSRALERELTQRQTQAKKLDSELDRIIAEEQRLAQLEEQRRLEAERQRKLEEERQERERLLAQQKEREEAMAREEAQKSQSKADSKAEKKKAEKERKEREKQAKKQAKRQRDEMRKKEEERQNELRRQRANKEVAAVALTAVPAKEQEAPKETPSVASAPAAKAVEYTPAQLTAAFVKNKGAMLFPVEGSHKIVGQFGRSTHANLSKVQLDNSGIDIETTKNATARAIFQGTVTSIFHLDGYHNIVMVRHGEYLTVYANVVDLAVRKGDQVLPGQAIGRVWADPDDDGRSILHFEVRKEREKLNPIEWVK